MDATSAHAILLLKLWTTATGIFLVVAVVWEGSSVAKARIEQPKLVPVRIQVRSTLNEHNWAAAGYPTWYGYAAKEGRLTEYVKLDEPIPGYRDLDLTVEVPEDTETVIFRVARVFKETRLKHRSNSVG